MSLYVIVYQIDGNGARSAFLPTLQEYGDAKNLYIDSSIDNGTASTALTSQMFFNFSTALNKGLMFLMNDFVPSLRV